LEKENINTLWQYMVRKEMKNILIEFQILNGDKASPPTYQEIRCHMIFDVKMEDFHCNTRFVAGGDTTDMQESVRITLTLAALNDLDVKMADDIENTYLTAPITEKIWTVNDVHLT
jgi:hypothetical protein